MKWVGRKNIVGAVVCSGIGVLALIVFAIGAKISTAQQKSPGPWVDPANPSDELVDGPYRVDPNWPKPLSTLFPEEKGWTWGAVQGIFAQNPERIFVAMRGELPDLTNAKKAYVELETAFGLKAHVEVPGRGMYGRNASVAVFFHQPDRMQQQLGR